MKKSTSLIMVLLFSALLLVGEAINASAEAALCCNDLSLCCNTECCDGAGTPSGCDLACASGSNISCPKKAKKDSCS